MFDPTNLIGAHTWISLLAIAAGVIVLAGILRDRDQPGWAALFLVLAFATSATGFAFPFAALLPSHIVGAVALVVLVPVALARYRFGLRGAWRQVYAGGLAASLYFLVFVGIAQAFQKIGPLREAAPTQSEAPFAVAQLVALVLFAGLGVAAARRFHRASPMPA